MSLDVLYTFVGSVIVFVVGQLLLKTFIEPAHELRKAIAAIRYSLLYLAPDILTPIGRTAENAESTRDSLLRNSADLYVCCAAVLWYPVGAWIFGLPEKENVYSAAKSLRGLSTYMLETGERADRHISDVNLYVKRIERALSLPSLFGTDEGRQEAD